jgi:hypothetical protein
MRYSGWKNFETWCVITWIESSKETHDIWTKYAKFVWDSEHNKQEAILTLAKKLEDHHRESLPKETGEGVYGDLLLSALSQVSWIEIADYLLKELKG